LVREEVTEDVRGFCRTARLALPFCFAHGSGAAIVANLTGSALIYEWARKCGAGIQGNIPVKEYCFEARSSAQPLV
jgi:hypothetical protein